MKIKKTLMVLAVIGFASFFLVSFGPSVAEAQWIVMPDGQFVHVGPQYRVGGDPTVSVFDPATGVVHQNVDAGLARLGLPPIHLRNVTGRITTIRRFNVRR